MYGALPAKRTRLYDIGTFWLLTQSRENATLAELRFALAHVIINAPLATRVRQIIDEETIAGVRLQCALEIAVLRVAAHLFASLLTLGRLAAEAWCPNTRELVP